MPRLDIDEMLNAELETKYNKVEVPKGTNPFEKAKQTNADRIRSMTDEELAEFFLNTNHYYEDGQYFVRFGTVTISDETEDILYWLKEDSEV